MYRCARIRITDLNPHLMCVLCGGYFVDATTVIECLHSFCRTCIVRYLESSKFCPICDVQVHKTRPLLNIRSDKTLQDLVYKLVPGLFEEEMRRRREFMAQHPEVKVKHLSLEDRGLAHMTSVPTIPEENISLVLEMAPNGHPAFNDIRKRPASHKRGDRRYLLCPCDVSVGHLKKFIRLKFNLPHNFEIDVFHPKSPEAITDEFTLLDITFVFSWNRKKPVKIYYCVFEKPAPKKRPAAATSATANNSISLKKARMDNLGMKPTNTAIVVSSTTTTASTNSLTAQKLLPGVAASVKVNSTDEKNEASAQVSESLNKRPKQENGTQNKVEHVSNIDTVISLNAAIESGIIASSAQLNVPDMHSTTEAKENIRSNILRTLKAESSGSSRSSSPKVDCRTASPKPSGNANSRTSSPKQANGRSVGISSDKAASGSNSRTASPKPTNLGNGRTASPKLTSGGNSRTASPKLSNGQSSGASSPKLVNARNGRTDIPKLALGRVRAESPKLLVAERRKASSPKLTNGRNSRTASPKTVNEQSSRTASPKPSNGRANGTSSPKLLNGRPRLSGPTVALVPVEQSITVDVNVGTETTSSSSEASPGVTSPGAEDRAHSVTMADLPDNLKNGPHVCNTAAFAPRPLPDLKPACLAQGQVKGVGQSQGRGNTVQAKQSKNSAKTKEHAVTSQPSLKSAANNKSKDKGKNKNKSALYCPI